MDRELAVSVVRLLRAPGVFTDWRWQGKEGAAQFLTVERHRR